jgi:hypothetical protein
MAVDLPEAADALRIGLDPLTLIRPEGDWDRPGVLERGIWPDIGYPASDAPAAQGWSPSIRNAWVVWSRGFAPGLEDGLTQAEFSARPLAAGGGGSAGPNSSTAGDAFRPGYRIVGRRTGPNRRSSARCEARQKKGLHPSDGGLSLAIWDRRQDASRWASRSAFCLASRSSPVA